MAGAPVCPAVSVPSGPAAAAAWHSAGSSRSAASRQMLNTPTWGLFRAKTGVSR